MLVSLEKTEKFYPGFQRVRLLSDKTFLIVLTAFVSWAVIVSIFMFFVKGRSRESVYVWVTILCLTPMIISHLGGLSRAGWLWFIGLSLFSGAGLMPAIHRQIYVYIFLCVPPFFVCLYMFHRTNPHIIKALGYLASPQLAKEIAISLLTVAVFIVLTYYAVVVNDVYKIVFLGFQEYIMYSLICLLTYGVYYGAMYGMLTQKLLNYGIVALSPIAINCVLLFLLWAPNAIGYDNTGKALTGVVSVCVVSQFVLGIAFYFCRSTRMLLFSYWIYYLFYKSLVT